MRQVFFASHFADDLTFDSIDALPVTEKLLQAILVRFSPKKSEGSFHLELRASEALVFLRDFYSRFELSQPQRRIWRRFENEIVGFVPDQPVWFVVADVSAHRSRRKVQKSQ